MLISTDDSQQPNPGCEWYQPTTVSGLQDGIVSMLLLFDELKALTGPFAATYPSSLFERQDPLPRH